MSNFAPHLEAGFKAAGGGKSLARFDVAPTVPIVLGADVKACRDIIKPRLALYVGGMGARGKNFYNELVCRYGYEAAAKAIQDLYLSGKKEEAAAAGAGRACGRDRAVRAQGAHQGAALALDGLRRHDHDLRGGPG